MNVQISIPLPATSDFSGHPDRLGQQGDIAGKLADGLRILRVALQDADRHRVDLGALHIAKLADSLHCPNLARIARELRSAHALGEDHATAALAARLFRLGQALTMGNRLTQRPR